MTNKSVDVIIIPAAGYERLYTRIKGSLIIYKKRELEGKNPLMILSGYDIGKDDIGKLVEELKNRYKIVVEPFSKSTIENAKFSKILLEKLEKRYNINSVAVVTDNKHVLRVRALFGNRLNDKNIEYIVVKDDRVMDFVYELFAIPFNFFGISLNSILARRYR